MAIIYIERSIILIFEFALSAKYIQTHKSLTKYHFLCAHRNRHITPFKSYLLRHVSLFTISVQHHLQLDLPSISEPFIISTHNYTHTITQFGVHIQQTTKEERTTIQSRSHAMLADTSSSLLSTSA